MVEGTGLENRQVMQVAPGFESQFLRHILIQMFLSYREVEQPGSSSGP